MNKRTIRVVGLAALLALGPAGAWQSLAQPASISDTDEIRATVESVDQTDRTVLLRGPEGNLLTVRVPPAVKNLAQVQLGDQVVVRYRESLVAQIAAPGSRLSAQVSSRTETAAPGQKPGSLVAGTVQARVRIQSVNRRTNKVSFIGPEGVRRIVRVEDPSMQPLVSKLKPGDTVDLTYTLAAAVSVEPMTTQTKVSCAHG